MADNYLDFSAMIKPITKEEHAWLSKHISTLSEEHEKDLDDGGDGCMHFEVELREDSIWFHTCEYGDPEHVANFVQPFLAKFRPKEVFSMEWAVYCSKLRLDEQGGGAIVVSKDNVEYMSTWSWRTDMEEAMRKKLED